MKILNCRAQQMIEYLLLLAITIITFVVIINPTGLMQGSTYSSIDKALNQLTREVHGPATVRCESMGFVYAECLVSPFATGIVSISLVQQESSSACSLGATYGAVPPNKMFVNAGCRGVFEVTYTSL